MLLSLRQWSQMQRTSVLIQLMTPLHPIHPNCWSYRTAVPRTVLQYLHLGQPTSHTHRHTHQTRTLKAHYFKNFFTFPCFPVSIITPSLESIASTSITRVILHQQWGIVYTEGPWGQKLTAHGVSKSHRAPLAWLEESQRDVYSDKKPLCMRDGVGL